MAYVGNYAINQFKTVGCMYGFFLIGKASQVQSTIEPVAAAVARKDAAGTIGPMSTWRQSDNQQLRLWVSEIGDGLAPVLFIDERSPFGLSDALTVFD